MMRDPDMRDIPTIHQRQIPDPIQRALAEKHAEAGYHLRDIPRGTFGYPSKIKEETEEFMDAHEQGCSIMALVELSDLYGAIKEYLKRHHPTVTMEDLERMSEITARAFENGHRT